MRRTALAATAVAGALTLAGCGADGSGASDGKAGISVGSAYMPQPVSDSMAAGFLTIVNDSGTKDELTSVTSDIAGEVTVHRTTGGTMEEVRNLAVPAQGRLVFESGGNHLMFENLKRAPKQGQTVSVELHFAESDPVVVTMPVKPATYTPKTGH
ncbi:copper chaperone PCu(A)C [Streptomyces luteolifulvus]|jgi:copper(I)-binding protein|uniref:Copper chaperone PCu(A)C n=1 Tax=Streptomyces luteolifulvus TaxID=2615112 RepID=A0A6H9V6A1_9ACTN|nr:copper chaperone PCu(A)C [Streptomyces luteolifulvus]KAB1149282.1 copper chaperone PCu(A)C [Streptomyces luteolifulvus]